MRCDQCQYWTQAENDYDASHVRVGLGECTKPVLFDRGYVFEKDDADCTTLVPKDPTLMMYVMDGSSYMAVLYTKPEFFCAHFTPKEKP